jgi:hypothetical protein
MASSRHFLSRYDRADVLHSDGEKDSYTTHKQLYWYFLYSGESTRGCDSSTMSQCGSLSLGNCTGVYLLSLNYIDLQKTKFIWWCLTCVSCKPTIQNRWGLGHGPCTPVNLMLQDPPRFGCVELVRVGNGRDDARERFGAPVVLVRRCVNLSKQHIFYQCGHLQTGVKASRSDTHHVFVPRPPYEPFSVGEGSLCHHQPIVDLPDF